MSDDAHDDIAVKLADVLRAVRRHPSVNTLIVDQACAEYGVEIDWDATPADQEGGGAVRDHG